MTGLTTSLVILGIIAVSLSIIALLYIITASRRRAIFMRKADYLIEDITYKSETLNSTVETVAKISNYIDIFEVVARKNMKSAAKVVSRNKDDIYKIINRIKKMAIGDEDTKPNNKKPAPKKKGEK